MSEGDVSNAIFKILEKELKKFNKFIPSDFFLNLKENLGPDLDKAIEKSGYISKSKYGSIKKLVDELEERITLLEKD